MEETRVIEHQIKASSGSNVDTGTNGLNGVDKDVRERDGNNEESHRESSIQNVTFHVFYESEYEYHLMYN